MRLLAGVLLGVALLHAQAGAPARPSADSLLNGAQAQAASSQRAVFVIFHASWCGWCRRLDAFLEDPAIKPVIDKYFVKVYFTVQEHEGKQDLNTAGGDELLAKLGGIKQGLPFFAFLDSQGKMLVNTIRLDADGKPLGSIGHPYKPYEVDWFLVMLNKAAPAMTAGEKAAIEHYLRTQEK